jgi:formate dehydrogenase major subunit
MINIYRRQFLKLSATTLAGSRIALMGFSPEPAMAGVRR